MWNFTEQKDARNHLFQYLDSLQDRFYHGMESVLAGFHSDLEEYNQFYILKAYLAGFHKQEIDIQVKGNFLTINAVHKGDALANSTSSCKEQQIQSFYRSFYVGDIQTDKISANYMDGVLQVKLPKKEEPTPVIPIAIF